MSSKRNGLEKILWSIAIPGFGQLLNKAYIKGLLLIILELIINFKANLNTAIIFSFLGNTEKSNQTINYYWLMYYPCIYFFAIWDAYKDAVKEPEPFLFLPFLLGAYFSTVGVIYSQGFKIMGILLGPIWLPIGCAFLGLIIGFVIKTLLSYRYYKHN